MRNPLIKILRLAVACVLLSGCGGSDVPETIPVEGTVKLDGNPVEGANVGFYPKSGGRPAMGRTDRNGHYTLSTFAARDGAIPGEHTVVISKVTIRRTETSKNGLSESARMGDPEFERARTQYLIPEKYSMAAKSGLTADVKPQCGPIDFDLTSQ